MPSLPDYRLRFDHPELEGIEVTMGRLSVDELFDFNETLALPYDDNEKRRAYWKAIGAFLSDHMVAWNLTDRDDQPVPVGQTSDIALLGAIRDGWLDGLNGGRRPLVTTPEQPAGDADLASLMQEAPTDQPEPTGSALAPSSSPAP